MRGGCGRDMKLFLAVAAHCLPLRGVVLRFIWTRKQANSSFIVLAAGMKHCVRALIAKATQFSAKPAGQRAKIIDQWLIKASD
jgi:hypothetical protein